MHNPDPPTSDRGIPSPYTPPDRTDSNLGAIGDYRLLRTLGAGGMGEVFLAEQSRPVKRLVALKVVRTGSLTRQAAARFQAEQQALALMDHPNVARVYDGGVSPDGRPFFVMEYVKGRDIVTWCREHNLDLPGRLRLLEQVCRAVQHAHDQGIIHRDLKPTNILVTTLDGRPFPKVIDFGIAKAVGRKLTDLTLHTGGDMLVGTPEYMSPEQTQGGTGRVDHRTDIYALGAVLYQLLTGVPPFATERLRQEDPTEVIRIIREEDPRQPSQVLAERIRRAERVMAPILPAALHGDLEWITLKALAKEPERRYASAAQLGDDLANHLASRPVLAGPPTLGYRLGKVVRRHRRKVVAGGVVAAVLFVLTLVFTAMFFRLSSRIRLAGLRLVEQVTGQELKRQAERRFWPTVPAAAPQLRRWLDRAEGLLANRPLFERELRRLEGLGGRTEQPREEAVDLPRRIDRQTLRNHRARRQALLKGLADLEAGRAPWLNRVLMQRQLREAEEEIDRARLVHPPTRWRLADPADRWHYERIREHLAFLDDLADPDRTVSPMADIRIRYRHATTVRERSVTGPEARRRWQEAIADIRTNPVYGGLLIKPQLGLLPLRRDPRSGLWEFWHLESGARPQPAPPGTTPSGWRITEAMGIILVLVPGGSFTIGARRGDAGPNRDPQAHANEGPPVPVRLAPFFIAKFELTQAQYARRVATWYGEPGMDRNRSFFKQDKNGTTPATWGVHPVEQVTISDCHYITRRLGLQLPTEAQWEYAARAGTTTPWHTGGPPTAAEEVLGDNRKWPNHQPVGSCRPNPWGLHDMLGNVQEICADGRGETCSAEVMRHDLPFARDTGRRVTASTPDFFLRGGAFRLSSREARSSARHIGGQRLACAGMRPVRPLDD